MKTVKLYDSDSYLSEFTAAVVSCEQDGDGYLTVLDKTAFFPEGGGQKADTGFIGEALVTDVQIKNGMIYHRIASPVEVGSEVECKIDFPQRFRRMQGHSGEHVFSGFAHSLYGCENVGFHLTDEVTIDFDIELDVEQIKNIERLSNDAVYRNVKITAEYPDEETLKTLEYRSKLELTEDVRIVTVEGVDVCACCAPHVGRTGEIGIIKVMSFMRHRGGVRIVLKCGAEALEDYEIKQQNLSRISVALCARPYETADIFEKFSNETAKLRQELTQLKKELSQIKMQNLESTDGNLLIFEDGADMPTLRNIVLDGAKKAGGLCGGFSGSDENGYIYVISSESIALRSMSKDINAALNGKGGGSDELIQGSCRASRKEIEDYFSEVK